MYDARHYYQFCSSSDVNVNGFFFFSFLWSYLTLHCHKFEYSCCEVQFFPEANEVEFARKSVFGGASFKLDYLTKPSFFEDFGFVTKIKMADRVKPEDELFIVGYPYFNVNGNLRLRLPCLQVSYSTLNFSMAVFMSFPIQKCS